MRPPLSHPIPPSYSIPSNLNCTQPSSRRTHTTPFQPTTQPSRTQPPLALQRYYRATSRELRRLEAVAKSPVYTAFAGGEELGRSCVPSRQCTLLLRVGSWGGAVCCSVHLHGAPGPAPACSSRRNAPRALSTLPALCSRRACCPWRWPRGQPLLAHPSGPSRAPMLVQRR